jgi:hypothetical protein
MKARCLLVSTISSGRTMLMCPAPSRASMRPSRATMLRRHAGGPLQRNDAETLSGTAQRYDHSWGKGCMEPMHGPHAALTRDHAETSRMRAAVAHMQMHMKCSTALFKSQRRTAGSGEQGLGTCVHHTLPHCTASCMDPCSKWVPCDAPAPATSPTPSCAVQPTH